MSKTRLEAFSDGVIAIILTIMVLELKAPHEAGIGPLAERLPLFLSYLLSFAVLAIVWQSHHELLHQVEGIRLATVWHNFHLLLWISVIPFATHYMGVLPGEALPAAAYGLTMAGSTLAFRLLRRHALRDLSLDPAERDGQRALQRRNLLTLGCHVSAMLLAWVDARLAYGLYTLVPLGYFVIPWTGRSRPGASGRVGEDRRSPAP